MCSDQNLLRIEFEVSPTCSESGVRGGIHACRVSLPTCSHGIGAQQALPEAPLPTVSTTVCSYENAASSVLREYSGGTETKGWRVPHYLPQFKYQVNVSLFQIILCCLIFF